MRKQLAATLPIKWFPSVARIIASKLKEENITADKTRSFEISGNDWSPMAERSVEDHISDPRLESSILSEVAGIAVLLAHRQKNLVNGPCRKRA